MNQNNYQPDPSQNYGQPYPPPGCPDPYQQGSQPYQQPYPQQPYAQPGYDQPMYADPYTHSYEQTGQQGYAPYPQNQGYAQAQSDYYDPGQQMYASPHAGYGQPSRPFGYAHGAGAAPFSPAFAAVSKKDTLFRWLIMGLIAVCLLMWLFLPLVKVSFWGVSFSVRYLDMAIGAKMDSGSSFGGYDYDFDDTDDDDFGQKQEKSTSGSSREGGKAAYFLTLLPLLAAAIALLSIQGFARYLTVLIAAGIRLISHIWITADLEIAGEWGSLLFILMYLIIIGLGVLGLVNARKPKMQHY